jgi:hypothetical protein
MNKAEALKQIEVFCKETFSQSNCSEWQLKTEDRFFYLQGTLRMSCQCLVQYECKVWIEFQNKYSKKLIVTVECSALERDQIPCLSWVEIKSSKKKIQGDGKNLDTLLTEAKKIMRPISDFVENEIQSKIDSSRKAKKDSHSQLTIDFIEVKIQSEIKT